MIHGHVFLNCESIITNNLAAAAAHQRGMKSNACAGAFCVWNDIPGLRRKMFGVRRSTMGLPRSILFACGGESRAWTALCIVSFGAAGPHNCGRAPRNAEAQRAGELAARATAENSTCCSSRTRGWADRIGVTTNNRYQVTSNR